MKLLAKHDPAPKVQFQFMSDLHLEIGQYYSSFDIPARAPRLILAGDIGRLVDFANLCAFFAVQCRNFQHVYWVLGNHEFYEQSHAQTIESAERLTGEPGLENLTLLHRTRVDVYNDVTILGCTLWSDIPAAVQDEIEMRVSDFKKIKDWSVRAHNAEHQRDLQWLKEQTDAIFRSEPHRRVLIVTHYAPAYDNTSRPEHKGSTLNPAFCTDLLRDGAIHDWPGLSCVTTWIFGHTHWTTEFRVGKIIGLANQRGYVFPNALPRVEPKDRWGFLKRRPLHFNVERTCSV